MNETKINRYPGVVPFDEKQKEVFFGRDKDIEKLTRLIKREQQVLLYAKSGLGKSSLVNAGVLPKIRQEIEPIKVRFNVYQEDKQTEETISVVETLKSSLPKITTPFFLEGKLKTENANFSDSLWLHFKALQAQNDEEKTYLLVFDQFEEIFSYPPAQITEFKKQISDLLQRDVPLAISNAIEKIQKQNPDFLSEEQEDFVWEKPNVKMLIVIREDRYSLLNKLTDYLPYCLDNRYHLTPLTQEQAKDAIVLPAQKPQGDIFLTKPFGYQPNALEKILAFLTKGGHIETTQLQILCNRLEALGLEEISAADIPNFDDIFLDFYEDSIHQIKDQDEQLNARRFIENELIKKEQRVSLDALACTDYVTDNTLKLLVDKQHLLRTETNSRNSQIYELAHDSLIAPILQAKEQREAEEAIKEAKEKAEQDRKEKEEAKKRLRKVQIALFVAVVAFVVAMGAVWFAFEKKDEAEEAKINANENLNKANKLINAFYFYEDRFALAYGKDKTETFAVFYFIDKNGNRVEKLGEWDKVEQFERNGFAKVWKNNEEYYLDTLGDSYKVAYQLKGISPKVKALDLSGVKLDSFPSSIFENTQLEILILSYAHFEEIPINISRMSNLKNLQIKHCKLGSLPKEIGNLEKLEVVNLEYNKLTDLPSQIGNLKNLRIFNLSYNEIQKLPISIGKLKKIEILNLESNKLNILPSQIGNIISLTKIGLNINHLTELPKEIGKLENLKMLEVGSNKLTNLPTSIGELKQLESLNMSGNALYNIPNQIGELQNVRQINLTSNKIIYLPKEIGNLCNLRSLNLADNKLDQLPAQIENLTNLKILSLGMNPISFDKLNQTLALLPHLEQLFLSDIGLTRLPNSILNMQSLKILDFRDNPFILYDKKKYNRLSQREQKEAKKKLPKCDIRF